MKIPPGIAFCSTTVVLVALLAGAPFHLDAITIAPPPSPDATVARRAADDLKAFYADPKAVPPYAKAVGELLDSDSAVRAAAGKYLAALLAQAYADELSGRAPSKSLPSWGGGTENSAVELRKEIAQKFADAGGGEAGLDAAQWLLDKEPVLENQMSGLSFVAATNTPRAEAMLRALLSAPHHNPEVLIRAIEEAAARKLDVAADIKRLCCSYRKAVREAARDAAAKLNIGDVPEYKPEEAFTPWLDAEMKAIAAMPYPEIPKDAKWMRFATEKPAANPNMFYLPGGILTEFKDGKLEVKSLGKPKTAPGFSGWLLDDLDGKLSVMDYFGATFQIDKTKADPQPRAFAEDAAAFADARKIVINSAEDMSARQDVLSARGLATGQFEPAFISSPEALVAAWAYRQGDKKLAAEIIFPRIDESPDDLEFAGAARDLIGKVYNQKMLDAFCGARDYVEASRIARHLCEPEFDGYFYQDRAKELVAQLQKRGEDFKTFTLPAQADWDKQKAGMARAAQIEFLAAHLRLLNCEQWGQPGDVHYSDPQSAGTRGSGQPKPVINPYNELRAMKMTGADIATLAPFLADEDFMLVYSYWRDFHPERHMHRVNWAVRDLINEAAGSNIADLKNYQSLDAGEKKEVVEKVLAWCRENGSKTRGERLLDTLGAAKEWNDFAHAASLCVQEKAADAALVMEKRMPDFEANRGKIMEMCYTLDNPKAAPFARDYLAAHPNPPDGDWTDEDAMQFWCAMTVLRASQPGKPEGLDTLKALLAKESEDDWYPFAFDLLMSAKTDEATDIACGVLKSRGGSSTNGEMIKALFLAGRKEALDRMLTWLDNTGDGGTTWSQNSDGTQKSAKLIAGDNAATAIAAWRSDQYSYDVYKPDDDRKAEREKLKQWLKDQFALVKAGKQPAISKPGPVQGSHYTLDAP